VIILFLFLLFPYFKDREVILVAIAFIGTIDFWTVKNICGRTFDFNTGRILVGLRWWVETDEGGTERWVFETRVKNENKALYRMHSRIFWFA